MGGALASALATAGQRIDSLVYRRRAPARGLVSRLDPKPNLISIGKLSQIRSNILIIATQDEELFNVASLLADKVHPGTAVFHSSGSISSEILKPFADRGCVTASLHPLASITTWKDGIERFRGSYFCLEGADKAVAVGKKLVKKLGGKSFVVDPAEKALYHAAAVTAAGHVTALFDVAVSLMVKSGLERATSRKILQPLLLGVVQNLASHDTPAALTGTFARGDEETLSRHLLALKRRATKDESTIYLDLAHHSIGLSERNGLDPKNAARMRRTIKIAKDALR